MPTLSELTDWFADVCEIQCKVSELRNKNPFHRDGNNSANEFILISLPKISIRSYIKRCMIYSEISEASFIATIVYMSKFLRGTNSELSAFLLYRLFGTSLVLAAKYCDDEYFTNELYAKIMGVSTKEMNSMEISLWKQLDYSCYVEEEKWRCFTECKICLDWQRMVFEMFQPPQQT